MDRDMMRALEADAAMLKSMGAGEQPLAFIGDGFGMRLTNATAGLWEVFDGDNVIRSGLSMDGAEALLFQLQAEIRKDTT